MYIVLKQCLLAKEHRDGTQSSNPSCKWLGRPGVAAGRQHHSAATVRTTLYTGCDMNAAMAALPYEGHCAEVRGVTNKPCGGHTDVGLAR